MDSNGKVTGVKAGTTKITVAVGGKKAVCTVTVKAKAKRYSDIEKVANLTAAKAASALGLKVKISDVHSVFYTENGKTGDGSSYMWCSQADTAEKGMWTFYANDNSISVYGARIGMSKASIHNMFSKKGWKKHLTLQIIICLQTRLDMIKVNTISLLQLNAISLQA